MARRNEQRTRGIAIGAVVALAVVALAAADPPAEAPSAPAYHGDAQALVDAAVAVTRAILREDAEAAGRELGRMAELAPPLDVERRKAYGEALAGGDRSLQITLTRARERAADGDLSELFNEFVWVQRSCFFCHGLERPASPDSRAGAAQ